MKQFVIYYYRYNFLQDRGRVALVFILKKTKTKNNKKGLVL